jgi:hypothetical protein
MVHGIEREALLEGHSGAPGAARPKSGSPILARIGRLKARIAPLPFSVASSQQFDVFAQVIKARLTDCEVALKVPALGEGQEI